MAREVLEPAERIRLRLGEFVELLRAEDMRVGPDDLPRALEAMMVLGLAERDDVYWALRSTLVKRHADTVVFDDVFDRFWSATAELSHETVDEDAAPRNQARQQPEAAEQVVLEVAPDNRQDDEAGDDDEEEADDEPLDERALFSPADVVTNKCFPDYAPEDYAELLDALAHLQHVGPWRRRRRLREDPHGRLDPRRTIRAGLRLEGHPVRQVYRRPVLAQRRLVIVCDVSGSMEPYARALLTFAYVAARGRRRVETFAFATRLTHVTRMLLLREPARALHTASEAVDDWAGGTRVGDALTELIRTHGGVLQGAVVLIASDGWDLGEPDVLADAIAAIQRRAYALVWVNPHLQDPQFEPLTKGMSAALPFVDHFRPCHNFRSFKNLAELLDAL